MTLVNAVVLMSPYQKKNSSPLSWDPGRIVALPHKVPLLRFGRGGWDSHGPQESKPPWVRYGFWFAIFSPLALWSCSICCSWWFLSGIQVEKYEITNSKKTVERSIFTSNFKIINRYLVYFSNLILPVMKNYFDHQDGAASQTLFYSLIFKTPGATVINI